MEVWEKTKGWFEGGSSVGGKQNNIHFDRETDFSPRRRRGTDQTVLPSQKHRTCEAPNQFSTGFLGNLVPYCCKIRISELTKTMTFK